MKTKAICSFFVLFAIVAGIGATTPAAFADPHGIDTADNDLVQPGCVDTEVGCYTPNTLTVKVGHIVTMTNVDSGIHTFTSGTVDGFVPSPSDVFDSGILNPNDSFELDTTDMEAGDYPYYCTLHVWMQGVLIVQEAAADADAMAEAMAAAEAEAMAAAEVELMVTITDSAMGDGTHVELEFSEIHVNYEIIATQNGETILQETGHSMELTGENYHIDAIGSDDNPIKIEIVSLPGEEGFWNGPTGIVATTQIVPEFGTIAMMVLAIAIISIVAVTAKSRVIPRF